MDTGMTAASPSHKMSIYWILEYAISLSQNMPVSKSTIPTWDGYRYDLPKGGSQHTVNAIKFNATTLQRCVIKSATLTITGEEQIQDPEENIEEILVYEPSPQ